MQKIRFVNSALNFLPCKTTRHTNRYSSHFGMPCISTLNTFEHVLRNIQSSLNDAYQMQFRREIYSRRKMQRKNLAQQATYPQLPPQAQTCLYKARQQNRLVNSSLR